MTFEERLKETSLPATAKALLPDLLSPDTRIRLAERSDMEEIIKSAIETIEHGSVDPLDVLIKKLPV